MDYIKKYFTEVSRIADLIKKDQVNKMINELKKIKKIGGGSFF